RELVVGDPRSEATFVGPIIDEKEAARIEASIQAAVTGGAKLLCGGGRKGTLVEPTVLEQVPASAKAWCEEIFGPVTALAKFREFDEATATVNDSRYGLQAGVFTRDIRRIEQAWDELDVGGVLINEVPSWRVDHMPYCGVKLSCLGREGI